MEYIDLSSESFLRKPGPPARIPFCVRTLGRTERYAGHLTRGSYFEDAMLTVFQAGKGQFLQGEIRQEISAGMIGLVIPGDDYGFLRADAKDPYTHYYCRFAGREALRMSGEIRSRQPLPFFSVACFQELRDLMHELWEMKLPREGNEPADWMAPQDALLARILALCCETAQVKNRRESRLTAGLLSQYILDHLAEPASLDQAADDLGLSKAYLCRESRRILGLSYQQAVEQEKMLWAATLLRDPRLDLQISEVAYRAGYADPLYFSKVFKRFHGQSPRGFRQSAG